MKFMKNKNNLISSKKEQVLFAIAEGVTVNGLNGTIQKAFYKLIKFTFY